MIYYLCSQLGLNQAGYYMGIRLSYQALAYLKDQGICPALADVRF